MKKHPEFDAELAKANSKGSEINQEVMKLLAEKKKKGEGITGVDDAIELWLHAMRNVGIDTDKLKDPD